MSSDWSRRRLLLDAGCGLGWLALSSLLETEAGRAAELNQPGGLAPHFAPRAKRVIQVFCVGGMSHLDTFDFKPELQKRDGQPYSMETFFGQGGNLFACPWEFEQRGESGMWVSGLLPHMAMQVDKMTVIRSMVAKSANHMPAIAQMNTGFFLTGFPSMGAWVPTPSDRRTRIFLLSSYCPMPASIPGADRCSGPTGFCLRRCRGRRFAIRAMAIRFPTCRRREG